jgi:hypothetical protein
VVLGTIKPKLDCILRRAPCVATLTVTASKLAPGNNAVVANYSGGLFTKPSSGSATVFVGTQTTCQSGTSPCSTTATSSDGLTSATINATPPGTGTETVQAFFNGEQLPCTTLGFGDTLNFTVTNSGGTKTITLTLIGDKAVAEHGLDPESLGNVCFGSTSEFVTNTGDQAKLNPSDGLFYGNLPLCDDGDRDDDFANGESGGNFVVTSPPCINFADSAEDTWATFTKASGTTPAMYTESFTTTAGDPKAHG